MPDKVVRDRHWRHCCSQVLINSVHYRLEWSGHSVSGDMGRLSRDGLQPCRSGGPTQPYDVTARPRANDIPRAGSALMDGSKWSRQSSILGDRKISYTL